MTQAYAKQLQKKLRSVEEELNFEIRKLTEDKAEQKLMLDMKHDKQVRALHDKLDHEKAQRVKENKKWIEKYDNMLELYEGRLKQKETSFMARVEELERVIQQMKRENNTGELKEAIEREKRGNMLEKERMKKESESKRSKMVEDHQEVVSLLNRTIKKEQEEAMIERKDLIARHREEADLKDKKIQALEEKLQETEDELSKTKTSLEGKIQDLKVRNDEYTRLNIQKNMVDKLANDRIAETEAQMKKKHNDFMAGVNKKLQEIKERELQACRFYEEKLKEIEDNRNEQRKAYEENVKQLQGQLSLTISHATFQNEVSNLKHQLTDEKKNFRRVANQAKEYKMELDNNEEVYKTFFGSTSAEKVPKITLTVPTPQITGRKTARSRSSRRKMTVGRSPSDPQRANFFPIKSAQSMTDMYDDDQAGNEFGDHLGVPK